MLEGGLVPAGLGGAEKKHREKKEDKASETRLGRLGYPSWLTR